MCCSAKSIAGKSIAALLMLVAESHALGADDTTPSFGTWTNPQRSVQVRAHPCGAAMCGSVVWANAKAQADARKGGTDKLIGAQLFRGFVQEREGVWRGKVFVPDISKTFSGTITIVDPQTLRASGCLLGRIGCKSQVWTRVDEPSG